MRIVMAKALIETLALAKELHVSLINKFHTTMMNLTYI